LEWRRWKNGPRKNGGKKADKTGVKCGAQREEWKKEGRGRGNTQMAAIYRKDGSKSADGRTAQKGPNDGQMKNGPENRSKGKRKRAIRVMQCKIDVLGPLFLKRN
jgi:hypothetical protein